MLVSTEMFDYCSVKIVSFTILPGFWLLIPTLTTPSELSTIKPAQCPSTLT